MDRFSLSKDNETLWFGSTELGPSTALYADRAELTVLTEKDGVVHTTMPYRIDLVFVADPHGTAPKVVGVELKRGQDLAGSQVTHKLGRQLATIGQTCDVVVLGISAQDTLPIDVEQDLVAYQVMGALIVNLPISQRAQLKMLAMMKPLFGQTRSVLRPFAWTDIDLKPRRASRGWLLKDIPFVGDRMVQKLLDRFGTVGAALAASDEDWVECGAARRIIDARREALS